MASVREMRRRIGSVKSISKITNAMKMVAAARLRKAQDAIMAARPYAIRITEVLGDIVARSDVSSAPLLQQSGGDTILVVLITADKGLCGGFNSNVFRDLTKFLKDRDATKIEFIAVGKKGRDFLKRRGFTIRESMIDAFKDLKFSDAQKIRDLIVDPYLDGQVGEVYIINNEFKSTATQEVVTRQVLPVQSDELDASQNPADFEYEPSAVDVFSELLPEYFAVGIWRALLESYSAELAARMVAMDAATSNAKDMIDQLTLVSNRLRQASITQEIAEIVGGAEAQK
ncbi:MAG: ATP synthase F1 subunit gamma [Candidatus Lindowbacteria bacterium]|nr:ATP synthase F1 subunit gamma [Candidatus Lindowbacteria bacterium]